ncbi:MAG: cation diffusion facilitator family transporter [Eubacteriales bacterium]|nr:cation diffusion facilitator family transporter [Eubacteriales bacterium]
MICLLVRAFVKDYENVKDPEVRQRYGMFSGAVGIFCNVLLFAAKFVAGTITGSVSIAADAFNNLSDAGSSIVTMLGFKIAGKPADPEHPYGHGRVEYIAGLVVAAAIVVMGFELLKSSFEKILNPEHMEFSILSVAILFASIVVKMWMAYFYRKLGKRISSSAMEATATDSLSDCISTSVVLISLVISMAAGVNIDGYAGAVVAVFVLIAGVGAGRDVLQPLLGQPPKKEFVDEIERLVMEDEHIIGIHDMIVHDYGPGRVFATLHAEVPHTMDFMEAHDCVDLAEQRVMKELGCGISIHMDPIVNDDENVAALKKMTQDIIKEIDSSIKMHDFRTTQGPIITNLIFDVVVPFGFRMTDEELITKIKNEITARNKKCRAVISVDKDYIGADS